MSKLLKYETLTGETIDYQAASFVLEFLDAVTKMVADPNVTEAKLVSTIYGKRNPILDQSLFADRGAVTKAVFANPVYHVMLDLLDRKRVQQGSLDPSAAAERYTLSVANAAGLAGVHESAIRQAIASKRLPAWKRDGRYYIAPEDLKNYRPAPHGPPPVLRARVGSARGARFSVKSDGIFHREQGSTGATVGEIANWNRAAVIAGAKEKARAWVLVPGETTDEIAYEGFYVRGRFRVVDKTNNPVHARNLFGEFESPESVTAAKSTVRKTGSHAPASPRRNVSRQP